MTEENDPLRPAMVECLGAIGITINVMADPNDQHATIGERDGYDDIRTALDLAIQSKRTHPKEGIRINNVNNRWIVVRVVE